MGTGVKALVPCERRKLMLEFDKSAKTLIAHKLPRQKKPTVYEENDMYTSYKDYLKNDLKQDIEDYVIAGLNEVKGVDIFGLGDVQVVESEDSTSTSKSYDVMLSLRNKGFELVGLGTEIGEPFRVMRLPYIDKSGILYHYNKRYAIIRKLVQADDITFDGSNLKMMTRDGYFVSMTRAGSEPRFESSKKAYSCIDVFAALADNEENSSDLLSLIMSMRSERINKVLGINRWLVDKYKCGRLQYNSGGDDILNFVSKLEMPGYSLKKVRPKFNEAVSLDRALGETLASDVDLPQLSMKLRRGQVITEDMLRMLKACGISTIYVKNLPNVTGYYTASLIPIGYIPKGTEMIPELAELIPGWTGLYMDKDYVFDELQKIPLGTLITESFLEAIWDCGVDVLDIVESLGSVKTQELHLSSTIMTNRHFKYNEIQAFYGDSGYIPSNPDEWVFLSEDGKVSPARDTFCLYDAIAYTTLFERLMQGYDSAVVADPDLGMRKKVHLSGDIIHTAISRVVPRYFNRKKSKIKQMDNASILTVNSTAEFTEIFSSLGDAVYQYMSQDMQVIRSRDITNPIAYYSMTSKVAQIMADANAIKAEQHAVVMGQYGKLCPFETPSGKKMGVVCNKALGCKIVDGEMKTSYYRVKRGRVDFSKIEWLGVREEEHEIFCDIASLDIDKETGIIKTKGYVFARVPNKELREKMSVARVNVNEITIVNVDPGQMNSLTISTVPFEGADDAARLTYETSMCKQAKALVKADIPYVSTSAFYDAPNISPYFRIQAEYDGVIKSAYNGGVSILYDGFDEPTYYSYETLESGTSSVVLRAAVVEEGQRVKAGDTLVTSNFVEDGIMTTGVNVLIAYVPKGANYEDGVYMSERLAQKMVSYHPKKDIIVIPKEFKSWNGYSPKKTSFLHPGDQIMNISGTRKGERMVEALRSKKIKGFLVDWHRDVGGFENKSDVVVLNSVFIAPANRGDKTANRHGNKGVAPEIKTNSKMLELSNGEFIDMCYNPMGVASRMNIGQILEANLGLCVHVLKLRTCISDSLNGISTEELRTLMSFTYHVANDDNLEAVFANPKFSIIPKELFQHVRENINYIRVWRGVFEEDGTAWLYDPDSGKRLSQRAVIGYNYVYKLIHESDHKEHARAGYLQESYSAKLASPTEGQAKGGGQRNGYMELDAMCAYGAVNLTHEILNSRGDNPILRNNMVVDAIGVDEAYRMNEKYALRRSTEVFTSYLEGAGIHIDYDGALPNATLENASHNQFFTKGELIKAMGRVEDRNEKPEEPKVTLGNMKEELANIKFDD